MLQNLSDLKQAGPKSEENVIHRKKQCFVVEYGIYITRETGIKKKFTCAPP
jgi:hypothetical protein